MGIAASQRAWHGVIRTYTSPIEDILWYTIDDVRDFFMKAKDYNNSKLEELMKDDVYREYHEIYKCS